MCDKIEQHDTNLSCKNPVRISGHGRLRAERFSSRNGSIMSKCGEVFSALKRMFIGAFGMLGYLLYMIACLILMIGCIGFCCLVIYFLGNGSVILATGQPLGWI